MNKFIEITEDIPTFSWNIFLFDQINNLMITDKLKTILLEMNKLCIMQPWIKIENTRNLYYYTHKNCVLEVADEKITYLLWENFYKEKMLEIEIISDTYDFQSVREFVDYFLTKYKLIIPLEWKSERGKKYLSK